MSSSELPVDPALPSDRAFSLKVVGVGGAGANAVGRLKAENLAGLQLAVINTDQQALAASPVADRVLIGAGVTRGLGAGGDPERGREAAEADRERITRVVKDVDLVFLVTGLGGGTGSGAAPVVASLAAEAGALVIAFVTLPFAFEGGRRLRQAEDALRALRQSCDAVIPLANDVLMQESADQETVVDSFARADAWVGRGVRSIWAMLSKTGLINLDFAALREAFRTRGGKTLFGLGEGQGENAVADALASLRLCPLLRTPEFSRRADRLLVNIVGGSDLTLPKVHELMTAITEQFGRESHVIMGAVVDETRSGRIEVCVIGTSEVGGRALPPRRAPSSPRAKAAPAADPAAPAAKPGPASASSPAEGGGASPVAGTPAPDQEEFGFGEVETRGHFEKTDRNLFDGQDLDVPTYLRRGIRISL